MQNPGNSGATSQLVPEVQMIQGVPMIVNVSECVLDVDSNLSRNPPYTAPEDFGADLRNVYNVLNDPNVMILVPDTFDTYKCKDCNIVLSGYKRGDPHLNEHIQCGGGQCRYVKAKFRGREKELLIIQGNLRFQRGVLAFPEFMFYSKDGHVTINRTEFCVVCAYPSDEYHYSACAEMGKRLKAKLKHLKLDVPIDDTPLFTKRGPGCAYRWGDLETDSVLAYCTTDFSVLGETANMHHIPDTVDTHKCFTCSLEIQNFVQNDTLLGEHIYHKGDSCQYIAEKFKGRRHELMLRIGKERYRKGSIAFPDTVTNADYGYTAIGRLHHCVVCSAVVLQERYLPAQGHNPHCAEMKKSLLMKLKNMKLLQ